MADSATLSITHQLSITIGEDEYKLDSSATITGVGNAVKRQVTVPTASEVDLLKVAATVAEGTLTDISFLVVQNVDDTNFCRLRVAEAGGETYDVKIPAGLYHVLWNTKINSEDAEGAFAAFSDWDMIAAQFDTADGELIIFAGEPC